MLRAATTPVPSVSSIAPHVPASLAAVIDRALAMAQDHRWSDARSMQTALRAACVDARLAGFARGEALARALAGPAFAKTQFATTGARLALATPSSPPPSRRGRLALIAGIAAPSVAFGGTAFVTKARFSPRAVSAKVGAADHAPPPPPAALPSAPAVVAAPSEAPAVPASALPTAAAPAKKTSGVRAKFAPRAQAAPAQAPAPAASDPFDRP